MSFSIKFTEYITSIIYWLQDLGSQQSFCALEFQHTEQQAEPGAANSQLQKWICGGLLKEPEASWSHREGGLCAEPKSSPWAAGSEWPWLKKDQGALRCLLDMEIPWEAARRGGKETENKRDTKALVLTKKKKVWRGEKYPNQLKCSAVSQPERRKI